MAHEKDDTTIRQYHIYILPHAHGYRLPKVGMSCQLPRRRKASNKAKGLNIEGHRVMEWITGTRAQAKEIEDRYQIHYDCVDQYTPESIAKMRASLKEQLKTPCPHCGLEVAANNMKRHHGDNCKQNPNRK